MKKLAAAAIATCLLAGCTEARATTLPKVPVELNSHPVEYSYDGWQTDYKMSGAYARLTVKPAQGIVSGTQDFVAVRMMAKLIPYGPNDKWLEIGYVTSGMLQGQTMIYTYDTGTARWHYYPEYPLKPGMKLEVGLFDNGGLWDAWLSYNGQWNKLTTCAGAGGSDAYFEYYVEKHTDVNQTNHVHITAPAYNDVMDSELDTTNAR